MLNTFDFRFAKRHMRYWQHAALLYWLDGEPLLVDATNGNIPFLFLRGEAARRLLDSDAEGNRPSVSVQMVAEAEDYHYHRVDQDIPQNLFFALEGWLDDTDLVQVFENELGLYLSDRHYVMPLPYRSEEECRRLKHRYGELCRNAGFRADVSADWTLDGPMGQELACLQPDGRGRRAGSARQTDRPLRLVGWSGPSVRPGRNRSETVLRGLSSRANAMSGGRKKSKLRMRGMRRVRSWEDPDPASHPGLPERAAGRRLVRPGTARGRMWSE